MPAGSRDSGASGPPAPQEAGLQFMQEMGSSQLAGRQSRNAWSCISTEGLKGWDFVVFFFTLRIYVFLLVPHLHRKLGWGAHPVRTPLFQSLPRLPRWFLLPTRRLGRLREFQTLCYSLGLAEEIVGVPSPRSQGSCAVSLWQTTRHADEGPAPSFQTRVRRAVKQKRRTKSVSRGCSPGRRHGCVATAALSGPGRCAASGGDPAVRPEDGLGSSPATVPPSPRNFSFTWRGSVLP